MDFDFVETKRRNLSLYKPFRKTYVDILFLGCDNMDNFFVVFRP
jgi:3-deoxy-D-arabino-heptulosonate 7-phosphate (DAHP) synthase